MEEIIWATLNQAKHFPLNLIDVIVYPRQFINRISVADRNPISGTIFLILACLTSAALLNLFSFRNLTLWIYQTAMVSLMVFTTTIMCGIVMILSWRSTQTTVSARKIMCLYLYHSGTWNILNMVLVVPLVGFLARATGMPVNEVIMALLDFIKNAEFLIQEPTLATFAGGYLILISIMICLFWGIPAWLAYKDLHNASKIRTVISLLVFCVGCIVVGLVFSFSFGQLYDIGRSGAANS